MQIQNATAPPHNATAAAHNATLDRAGIHVLLPTAIDGDPMATRLQMLWILRPLHNRRQLSLMPVRLYSPTKEVD